MNRSDIARNYAGVFHQFVFVNETILPIYISPSDGYAISSIDHIWHKLNSPGGSFVVSKF